MVGGGGGAARGFDVTLMLAESLGMICSGSLKSNTHSFFVCHLKAKWCLMNLHHMKAQGISESTANERHSYDAVAMST